MSETNNRAVKEQLIQALQENPEDWGTRKEVASILFEEGEYIPAADMLWGAPEIPSVDIDVAFSIKVISRGKPNRAIRMMNEIVQMNKEKPNRTMAVAMALFDIGMYTQASRFYGAALVSDPSLFNLDIEQQMIRMDDSGQISQEDEQSSAVGEASQAVVVAPPALAAAAPLSMPVQPAAKPSLVPTPMTPPPKQARQPVPMKPVTAKVELPEQAVEPPATPLQSGSSGKLLTPPVSLKPNS